MSGSDWGLILALVVGVLVVTPIVALATWVRLRKLERQVARLEHAGMIARGEALAKVSAPTPAPVAPVVPVATVTPVMPVTPVVAAAADAPAPDLETVIAGQWLNRIGLAAVAIGVSYFLKYAIDNDWIGPSGQVAIGLLLGVAIVAVSYAFVQRGHVYFGDGLTGLGGAILYLSLWAGGSYYHLFSSGVEFVAMAVVTASLLVMALGRNSERVAVLGMVGGFTTPWLVSTGQDAQVALFSYLAVLNAALLPIARMRDWRTLELPAFALTQLYFWTWYDRFYAADRLWSTAAFATLFFVQFAALQVARSLRTAKVREEELAVVLFNAGVVLLTLRVLLWPDHRSLLTAAALVLASVYLLMARVVHRDEGPTQEARMLFAGLALTMVTLAIPIQLEGRWITMAWAIEAAVLMVSGCRVNIKYLRSAAFLLFGFVAWRLVASPIPADAFLFNARFGVCLVVIASAGAALWAATRARTTLSDAEQTLAGFLAVGANALAVWTLTLEVGLYFRPDAGGAFALESRLAEGLTVSMLWTVYASGLMFVGVRAGVAAIRWQGLALFGLATAKVFIYDLGNLQGFYRIVSSIALGVVLLIVSFLYQRSLAERTKT